RISQRGYRRTNSVELVVRASLARLMPNVGGPKQSRRLLL
ncbi:GSCOCG00011589001-RA-CDS, partial [Cotesia congregata]